MTTIFLDVDGVLNQLQKDYIDVSCVKVLKEVSDLLNGCNIVLVSTWRKGFVNFGKCSPQVEHLKDVISKYELKISGRTGSFGDRHKEIEDYVSSHDIKNYIILDDDKEEYSVVPKKFYLVNNKTGLTKSDVKKIIKFSKL